MADGPDTPDGLTGPNGMDLDGLTACPEAVFDEERGLTEVLTDDASEAISVEPLSEPISKVVHGRARAFPVSPAVTALLEIIRDALLEGESVHLPGLGSFSVQAHPARTGRNPHTGEPIAIPAGERVHFKNAEGLRRMLNSGD